MDYAARVIDRIYNHGESGSMQKALAFSFAMLTLFATAFLVGCSRDKSIDRDQTRSEIRSAISFAAESEWFIDFVLRGHAPRHYAEEHTAYLEEAIGKSAKELKQTVPEAGANDSVRECQIGLNSLARELSGIRTAIAANDKSALAAAFGRITAIRESLEKANAHL
jgi:hypothetical protein